MRSGPFKYLRLGVSAFTASTLLASAGPSALAADAVERISVTSAEGQANGGSGDASVSGDGRFVLFKSNAENLGYVNGALQFFVRDRVAGTTRAVTLTSQDPAPYSVSDPVISRNGRFVLFQSSAPDLVPADTNGALDVFVHDLVAGTTVRASTQNGGKEIKGSSFTRVISADGRFAVFLSRTLHRGSFYDGIFVRDLLNGTVRHVTESSAGMSPANGGSDVSSISGNGRFVGFWSESTNLVVNDMNSRRDAFVWDRKTRKSTLVSVATGGAPGDRESEHPHVSDNGRFVAFGSKATNLVPGDTNGATDAFVRDTKAGTTTRISMAADGSQANGGTYPTGISADGRYVLLISTATNLVPGDTNDWPDVFLYDRAYKRLTRVTPDAPKRALSDPNDETRISADGRVVVLGSTSPDLVPGDTNRTRDIFAITLGAPPSP